MKRGGDLRKDGEMSADRRTNQSPNDVDGRRVRGFKRNRLLQEAKGNDGTVDAEYERTARVRNGDAVDDG